MKRKLSDSRERRINDWVSKLSEILRKIQNREIFVNLNDSSTILLESDCMRAVSELLPESAIRNLFLSCIADAEQRSPGASFIMMSSLSSKKCDESFDGMRFNVDELRKSLQVIVGDDAADLCLTSLSLAGKEGKILLDSSLTSCSEICYGTQICSWKPDPSFFIALGQHQASIQDCRVVFVDGIIESVSECHRLFQESYDRKIPIAIFARGFSEEVIATAAVNIKRQTAQILPILIPFDEVGVNGMGDLAGCFAAELISSDKGHLISNVNIDSCVSAARISCSEAGTEIEHANDHTSDVIARLTDKLSNSDSLNSDLVRRRLRALGGGMVTIKVGLDKRSLAGIQRDRVDFGLRYSRKCMSEGVTKFNNLIFPISSVKTGIECAKSFRSMVENCGAILEIDRCG